jgi:two-component system, OmpR family, sensor histidine kinase CpxA
MKSLFARIFLWFWLAMTLIGAIGVVVVLTTDPRAALLARHEKEIARAGKVLIRAYETQGPAALAEEGRRLERRMNIEVFLFRGDEGPLSGRFVPPRVRRLAEMAGITGEPQHGPGRKTTWYAIPAEGGYVVLASLPRPSPIELMLDPRRIVLRLCVTFMVAGIVCYLLARSLTGPILHLQKAARRFADGDLATRVGPVLGNRKDEIAVLGHDFDRMAGRIESMVNAQRKLLRDISHELRSPLARLNVALELARRSSSPEAGSALDRMGREADRLNELIGQLLTLTMLEGGAEKVPEQASVDLSRLVRDIVDDANFEARDRNCSVEVVSSQDITVKGSEELLRRAIENVVRNAVRYTDEGTAVEVSLSRRMEERGTYARIRVRDHGPGVREEALKRLFEPFYRVAEARDRLTGGTGIGLAITEKAVHLHSGTVRASNDTDGGLVVEIDLPVDDRYL